MDTQNLPGIFRLKIDFLDLTEYLKFKTKTRGLINQVVFSEVKT